MERLRGQALKKAIMKVRKKAFEQSYLYENTKRHPDREPTIYKKLVTNKANKNKWGKR